MRKSIMAVLVCFLVFDVNAQIVPPVVEWKKNLGGDRNDFATSIIRSRDNGYIVLGTTYSNNGDVTGHHGSQDSSDAWVVKLNESGTVQWQRSLGGSRDDELKDVIELANGDLLCVGTTNSENGDISGLHTFSQNGIYYSFSDLWVIKLTSTGQTIWSKVYGGTDPERGVAVKKAVDGGYIIAGDAESNDFDVTGGHGWSDLWLLKIDDNGNKQWQKTYGNYNSQFVSNLVVTSDGNYLVTGWQHYKGFPPVVQVIYSYSRLTRLLVNSSGNVIWEYYPLFPELVVGRSDGYLGTIEMPSKQLMMIGFEGEGSGTIVPEQGRWNFHRVLPPTGELISSYFVSESSPTLSTDDRGKYGQHASVLLSDTSLLTCFRTYDGLWSGTLHRIHTDTNTFFYKKEFGGSNLDGFTDMALLNDNELVMVGVSESSDGDVPGNKGGKDLWVLKLNSVNTIKGNVFIDLNANGIKDAGEPAYANAKVQSSLGGKAVVSSTDSAGKFVNFVDTIGTYSTTVLPFRPYYTIPFKQTVFTGFNQKDSFSLALVPIGGKKDLLINAIALDPTRGGFDFRYKITYSNIGTETINNCVVRVVRDKYLTYVSSSPAYSGFVADTLLWNVGNLAPLSSSSIIVTFHVPPPASIALNTITSLFSIDPSAGDETPVDNSQLLVSGVTGSFDPNDKEEAKGGYLTPEELSAGEYLRYTIRFQNTGNDTAFNISIRDSLTSRLEWNSFEMVGFSHPYHLKMENGRLTWTFKNILLPDSNRNEPLSHGYITYRIKPKTGLVVGDTIRNSASIYFDFNAPVKTNEQLTVIRAPLPQPSVTGLLAAYCSSQGVQKGKITNLPAAASGITVTTKLDATLLAVAADSTFSFDVNTLNAGNHSITVSFTNSSGTKTFSQSFSNTLAITPDVNMSANITNVISLSTPVIITAANAAAGGTAPLYTFAKDRTFSTILQAEGASNVVNINPSTLSIGDNWIYVRMKSNATCITTQSVVDSIKIIRDQATGITDPDNPGKVINIYPNPFSKQLYISGLSTGKTYMLYLTNLNGQLLQQKRISNRSNAELMLQKENAGTYLLNVYDEKKKVLLGSVKIVKQ